MSTNLAYAGPVGRPRERFSEEFEEFETAEPRRVRIVTTVAQRRARPKIVYAIVATAVIFGIFLAQLMLSIALSGGAYRISTLQAEQVQDGRIASSLSEKLNTIGSTQNLAANARALGMVASASQAFLRLSDGKVLGTSTAAPTSSPSDKSGATSSVPNSLLDGIPLVKTPTSGHGDANATESTTSSTQSNSGSASGSSSSDSASTDSTASTTGTPTDPGTLPSPQN
jgi:hypothetical protein